MMTNLELAQEIYFALEERQFDMDSAGFIAVIEAVLDKCNTAENDALQNLTARTTEALQSLTVISERRHEMVTDLQAENERLRLLVKRTIDAGSQLFSDPGLDKNWHWKGYLLELDQIVVAGREALKELGGVTPPLNQNQL